MFAWPAVCIALFVLLPLEAAAIWSLLGAYLLLPSGLTLDVPLLPPIDKMSIAAIATFLLCWMKGSQNPTQRASVLIYLLSACFVIAPVLTSLGNSYELHTAAGSIPGFYPLDGVKVAGRQLLALLPFFVGMRFISTDYGRAYLLKSLPIATLFYSLPMLFEVRMSPQLHRMVYGYFPASFAQQIRAGGFRPVVFLSHGLQLALFTSLAVIAAVIIARARSKILRVPAGAVAGYLSVLLLLCKTLGAALYALTLTPVILLTRPRTWAKVACLLLLLVCAYPVLRTAEMIPVQQISSMANAVSTDRSESLQTRLVNEQQLLAKANEKPMFGWGTWGRNRLYDQYTGKDISVTDGEWIIELGTYGWFGYLSLFLLLTTAALRAHRATSRDLTPQSITLGGLTLLLGVYVIDMLPNSSNMPLAFLLAGSVSMSRVRKRIARSAAASLPVRGHQATALASNSS